MNGATAHSRLALTLLLLVCCPLLAKGQQSGGGEVSGSIGGHYKATRLAGGIRSMVGVKAVVIFAGGLEIGIVGIKLLEAVDISTGPGNLLELRPGYGGVTIAKRGLLGSPIGGSLLIGAGNAEIRALPVGNQLGSDNFFVIEPEVTLALPRWKVIRSSVGTGFRFVTGVDDLPTLSTSDLRGLTVTLTLALGGP